MNSCIPERACCPIPVRAVATNFTKYRLESPRNFSRFCPLSNYFNAANADDTISALWVSGGKNICFKPMEEHVVPKVRDMAELNAHLQQTGAGDPLPFPAYCLYVNRPIQMKRHSAGRAEPGTRSLANSDIGQLKLWQKYFKLAAAYNDYLATAENAAMRYTRRNLSPYSCTCGRERWSRAHRSVGQRLIPFLKLYQCHKCGRHYVYFVGLWLEQFLF